MSLGHFSIAFSFLLMKNIYICSKERLTELTKKQKQKKEDWNAISDEPVKFESFP